MTAPSKIRSGVGFRHVQVISLGADSHPAATDTTYYAGTQVTGARSLTITDPEPQQIVHVGDDRPFALDVLPPTEPITGELTVSKLNDTIDELLSDDKAFVIGEANLFPLGSDSKGDENQVALLCYRQTVDTDPTSADFGSRRWEFRLFPKCYVVTREGGLTPDPEQRTYTVRPQFVKAHLWGTSLAAATEGCEQAQGFRGVCEYKPRIVSFLGDTSTVTFTFETAYPAQATGKIAVYVNGVLQTTGVTKATNQLVFSAAPDTDANIDVFYEHNQ